MGEDDLQRLWAAGQHEAVRRIFDKGLAAELAEAIYPEKRLMRFSGAVNRDSDRPLRLQYLLTEQDARAAVLDLPYVAGDLGNLIAREACKKSPRSLDTWTPRERVRAAILCADFWQDLGSNDGQRRLQRYGEAIHRKYPASALEGCDVCQTFYFDWLDGKLLPSSWAFVVTHLERQYQDESRRARTRRELSDDAFDLAAEDGEHGESLLEQRSDLRDRALESSLTKLRKEKLFGLLAEVHDHLPKMQVNLPTHKKPLSLDKRHQTLFSVWLSLQPVLRIDPGLSLEEIAEQFEYSLATCKRLFQALQIALTQHPRYDEILSLVEPTCSVGGPEARARHDLMLRHQREETQRVFARWREELEDNSSAFAATPWPTPERKKPGEQLSPEDEINGA